MKAPTSDQCLIHSSQVEWARLIGSSRVKKPTSFRNNIQISKPEMAKYFGCPQRLAAQKLGVSLSTLKRRFYQLGIGRWPYQTHETNRRSIWHMVNEVESKSEKYLSPETVQTLTHLFSMSLQEQQQLATIQHPLSQSNHSINRKETNFKFLHYVPTSERLLQSENQTQPTQPTQFTRGFKRDPEDFCNSTLTSDASIKYEANIKVIFTGKFSMPENMSQTLYITLIVVDLNDSSYYLL